MKKKKKKKNRGYWKEINDKPRSHCLVPKSYPTLLQPYGL